MELNLALNAGTEEPLHAQLFEQIRRLILAGKLHPGSPLPSSRALAEKLFIGRNTVLQGYDRLTAEGYIETRGTSGTFVSSLLPDDLIHVEHSEVNSSVKAADEPEPVLCFAGSPGGDGSSNRPKYDFWVGRSAEDSFPINIWKKLLVQTLNSSQVHIADYSDPVGLLELRQEIAHHLARSRGMIIDAEQVIITAGSQEGLNLIHRLLNKDCKTFFVENPCYQGAALLFQSLGVNVQPIRTDESGLDVHALPNRKSSAVFVTPSHQFPLGTTLSLERRLQLLHWAEHNNSVIIEDDYDSDFRYDGPPLTALAGLDKSRRVFYMGTFSKSLGAGLRLGYTVIPSAYVGQARQTKAFMDNGQPWLEQVVLSKFLSSGSFDRHLRRVRKIYKERRDQLIKSLGTYFPETNVSGYDCGLHLVWKLPDALPSASELQTHARSVGVGIYSLKSGAAIDYNSSSPDNLILLGYSSVEPKDIRRAVRLLRALVDSLQTPFNNKNTSTRAASKATKRKKAHLS